ncbi:nuclear pore complex protein NUP155-like [Selaginella moellendorffii]|uniref:nuclear pore complex protein NUP155-like n=1 Tax=Selaginella moellendorffii TaxID=88036 RepID=UPI000D1D0191|nr:nuclear pore complex protein NUP155-like [Selaginella moellendorffii]|eukprot:XP_024539269.1 nuclear pore complex protein NUP155-like [Selaginella moellendorffii]
MSWEDEAVVEDIAAAGRLLSDTINRDLRCYASGDLLDALDAGRYSSHPYASPQKEWPPYIDVSKKRELPPQVMECYNAGVGQGMAFCGIFPTIRRAWATVDETLFMWRFDKWDGTCVEYSGEEQAICAVGLAKAKAGVFVEAIQHLLVLATPVELVLLGVCCGASSDGSDAFSELSLQPLPEYTVPTDGVTMTCVISTEKGRIFLGGRDGHIYELLYTTGLGWQSRCRKICHTGGFGSMLSRWIIPNGLKFGAADSILEIAVDDERNIMYARTQESKVQAFDLGRNGDTAPKKVGEEKNFGDQRDGRHGSIRNTGSRGTSRAPKATVVSLAPLSSMESKWLHLVAIVSDGRRVYLSTTPTMGGSQAAGGTIAMDRPSLLRIVSARPGPSVGVGGGISLGNVLIGTRPQGDGLKVQEAQYSSGNFLLADSSPSPRLLVARKDYTSPLIPGASSPYGGMGASGRNMRALREVVTTFGADEHTYAIVDMLPPPEQAVIAEALVWDSSTLGSGAVGEVSRARALWALGDLATQHILPRRRAVIASTRGLTEIVMNRPVDLLQRLFESNTTRAILEEFFQRFGAGEAAAMCLLLAARIVSYDEKMISTAVVEKAAEAFEDPRLVGVPQMQGGAATTTPVNTGGGFNMGQVVQEAEPVFSGAHEGLCLCASRLLWSVWELPVFIAKGDSGNDMVTDTGGIISCRISPDAMNTLEDKIRSLEMFLRARRNQRRGHYGRIMGIGDLSGYGDRNGISRSEAGHKLQYDTPYARSGGGLQAGAKRQRVAYSPAELTAMEVRGMECVRRLLRRSAEALFLLQLLSQHHLTRLVQSLESEVCRQLAQLSFHQLVCSQEGEYVATRLIGALMEYYVSPEGKGTVDDISTKLRDGCPSYYNEADDKFYQAVQCLEKAANARDVEVREHLAREALDLLARVPETANLLSVCPRFEEIRFYEAVVELPLRKAKALDPNEDAFNAHIDENRRKMALASRQQCYEVITNALRSLVPQTALNGNASKMGPLDANARMRYVRQIVQLGVRSPDRAFHEYLYESMIELGLEKELLELAGPDLVPFLQAAGDFQTAKPAKSPRGITSPPSVIHLMKPITTHQAKYLELLSRYYVHKRQHALAAYVLLRLGERKGGEGGEQLTLEARHEYLSHAVVQARSIRHGALGSNAEVGESGLLELLEGKLAVLRFQLKIQAELEAISSQMAMDAFPPEGFADDEAFLRAAREKALELGAELKSITQLYNNYAVPFKLWEVCLEILHFSHYTSDAENNVMRETWARLIDQAITIKGIAEACTVVKRVGPQLYPGDGGSMPLDSICLHLERAAEERVSSSLEIVGDEDIPRALLAACHDSPEPVQRTYDQLLSSTSVLPSTALRLRLLRSALAVMREWTILVLAQRIGSIGGSFSGSDDSSGVRDRLCSTVNRYMTEVKRLPLSPAAVEPVSRGFKELEEMLLGSQSLQLH